MDTVDKAPIPRSDDSRPYKIGILLLENFALMSFSAAIEPVRAANFLAEYPAYELTFISIDGKPVISSGGAVMPCTAAIGNNVELDMLLVISSYVPAKYDEKRLFQWLRSMARRGVILGGVSGGPIILAMAGVMDGYRMTVHWEHLPALLEKYPDLLLERSLYVIDRTRVTCAGGVAPLDLMHALISERHGAEFATKVSDWYLHTEVRPSGGPQRAGLVERYGTHSPSLVAAIELMENHIADPLTLNQIASVCEMSSRQLNRLFRDKMGQSTMAFYRDVRLEIAQNLLTQSTLSVTEIALATGFANSAHFSQTFKGRFDITPSTLRS